MKLYPLKFTPIFKERIWGSNNLNTILNKQAPIGNIGESWEIVDRKKENSIIENGFLKGKSLKEIRLIFKDQLLGQHLDWKKEFPLLIKILDCNEDLSLQVHPKKSDLKNLPLGSQSKTEFWYILDHKKDAQIMVGLKNISKEEFKQSISSNNLKKLTNEILTKKDTLYYIPSGLTHAIGGGNLILEIQENSDTTYRVSDWGRVDSNNQMRKLHIEESLLCIDFANQDLPPILEIDKSKNMQILDKEYFDSFNHSINKDGIIETYNSCEVISITSGKVIISANGETISLKKGENALLPFNLRYEISNISDSPYSSFLRTIPKN